MQYIKEAKDGSRKHVNHWEWTMDKSDKAYRQLLAAGLVVIYKMH